MLRVLSHRGDDTLTWDTPKAEQGDPDALAAVREAERIFAETRAHGGTAYVVEGERPPRPIEQFDPHVEQIVLIPRVIGG
ncbi:MAG TPA: hypothetical protein VKQ36_11800 [Ktedonobacterales bacterium]|nr:hypothetical protein [Ktedonobacterales bacterium]